MMDKSVRSQFPSIKLDQLVYVELESSNGGMMLTVSEDGFSFRAVTPVRPTGRIPFSFIINGTEKLEGFGKVDWTKDDGKVAGLQFTDVTTEFLNALRKWLAQLSAPAVPSFAEASFDGSNSSNNEYHRPLEPTKLSAFEPAVDGGTVQPLPELGLNFGQSLRGIEARNGDGVARVSARELPNTPPRAMPVLSEWNYPTELQDGPRPRIHGVAITAVVICFVALAVVLYGYREAVGQSLISLGQKLSASSETSQSQPSKPTDAPKPAIETPPTPTAATPAPEQEHVPSQPGTVSDSRYNPPNIPSPTKPESTFQDTRPESTAANEPWKDSGSHDSAEQVRLLWSAVSKGNTSAEVTLAKLYLIGGGVTKSCDQARVLLQAAAKKGNGEAVDKLSQINRQGCP